MTALSIAPIRLADFAAETSQDRATSTVRLTLTGNADAAAITPLTNLLTALHPEVVRTETQHVIVDLVALEFMNSSCFKSFVTWITSALEMPTPYRITFRSSPSVLWQRRSLHALASFATELVTIETV